MLLQTDLLDEVEVGIEYLLRRMIAQHADQQGHDALDDERVTLGGEADFAVGIVGLQPYPALAAVDQVLLGLVLVVERRLFVAQVYQQLLLVHPVVETGELIYDLVLNLVDGHVFLYLNYI